jgi:hypothetical protein
LRLAARQPAGRGLADAGHAQPLQPWPAAPPRLRPRHAREAQPELRVAARAAATQQRALEGRRRAPLRGRGRLAVEQHVARALRAQARGDPQQRRLAGAVRAEHGRRAAGGQLERGDVEDPRPARLDDHSLQLEPRAAQVLPCCCSVALRAPGTGTRALLDRLVAAAGDDPGALRGAVYGSHLEVALAVASGAADAGVATRAAATALGLEFVPLAWEPFELALPAEALELAEPLLAAVRERAAELAAPLGGYEIAA